MSTNPNKHHHHGHGDGCDDPGPLTIVIDRIKYKAPALEMTGTELRNLARPRIGDDRDLWRDIVDALDDVVDDDEVVRLEKGMRFFTVPREINPGQHTATGSVELSAIEATGLPVCATVVANMTHVVIEQFPLPTGLSAGHCDLLLRLPSGFPDASPDMFWISPPLAAADGTTIGGTQSIESYNDRQWQRWSRHIGAMWRPGIDDLETYIGFVRSCLSTAARQAA